MTIKKDTKMNPAIIFIGLIIALGIFLANFDHPDNHAKDVPTEYVPVDFSSKGKAPVSRFLEVSLKNLDPVKFEKSHAKEVRKYYVRNIRQSALKGKWTLLYLAVMEDDGGHWSRYLNDIKKYTQQNKNLQTWVVRLDRVNRYRKVFPRNFATGCFGKKLETKCVDRYFVYSQHKNDLHYDKLRNWVNTNYLKGNDGAEAKGHSYPLSIIIDDKGDIRYVTKGSINAAFLDDYMKYINPTWKSHPDVKYTRSAWPFTGGSGDIKPEKWEVSEANFKKSLADLPELFLRMGKVAKKTENQLFDAIEEQQK